MDFVTHAAEDTSLCDEVLELLRHHHPTTGTDDADASLVPPDRIGPFRIIGLLGRGGMGVVYRAQRDGDDAVALKVLDPGMFSARFVGRFRREVEALRRLDHPGIARFHEAGIYESIVGPRPYCAMELVEGESLREKAKDDAWDARGRITLLADLADALHHAHEHGIIHRDLKPENVVVTPAGRPKVLDFGVARITADDLRAGTLATGTGVLLGTVRYMSPEQAQGLGDEVDRRSDVYALGVLAYELLAGAPPYDLHSRSVTRALVQVATAPARPLGEVRPALRGPIERIVARALAKAPADRYPTAAELAAELRRYLAGERVHTPGPSFFARVSRQARRRPLRFALATLASIALLAIATRGLWPGAEPSAAAARGATARACALLDSVDIRLHHETRTVALLDRCLALLRDANAEIRRAGSDDYVSDLRRYAAWREGEAHFFRASADHDPDGFLRAAEAWARAREPARLYYERVALPDTTVPIYPRIIARWPHQADAGISLAYAEAARERLPARFSTLAHEHALAAWVSFAGSQGEAADPLGPRWVSQEYGIQARLLNELGAAAAAVGFYENDPAKLDRGLRLLQRAERAGGLGDDPAAAASVQHNLGQTWLWRGRLLREPAALDTAIARLGLALTERTRIPGNSSEAETRMALAEALRLKARLEPGRPGPGPWIERADGIIREALQVRGRTRTGSQTARLLIARAAVLVDAGVLAGDSLILAQADSLLVGIRTGIPRDRLPVTFARIERERGRAAAARWLLDGSPDARVAALSRFASAADALTMSQHRPFRLENDAALQGMSHARATPPRLTDPVIWP